jgi:hypothetical protein
MKAIFALLMMGGFCAAGPIIVGPTPITGGGTFGGDPPDILDAFMVSASGPGVSISAGEGGLPPGVTCISGGGPNYEYGGAEQGGGVYIDGIGSQATPTDTFGFSLCNGTGYAEIFDGNGNELAYANLIGTVVITSYTVTDPEGGYSGTFAIVDVPEASTGSATLLGVFALGGVWATRLSRLPLRQ